MCVYVCARALYIYTHTIIIIIIIKKGWQCMAGKERLTPCQYEDPCLNIDVSS